METSGEPAPFICFIGTCGIQLWGMTPRELAMILATRRPTQAPDRAALDDLMRSFPDRKQFP